MAVDPIVKGVPSPNPGRAGAFARCSPTAPQFMTNNHRCSGVHRAQSPELSKPALSSPKASHYGYQNSEGPVDVNLNLKFLWPMTWAGLLLCTAERFLFDLSHLLCNRLKQTMSPSSAIAWLRGAWRFPATAATNLILSPKAAPLVRAHNRPHHAQ